MTGSTAPCISVWEFQHSIKNCARDSESQRWLPKSASRIWFWVCWLKWQKLLEWCVPLHRTPVITSPPSKLCVCMCVWGEQMIVIPVTHSWWPHNYANDHHHTVSGWTEQTQITLSHTHTHTYTARSSPSSYEFCRSLQKVRQGRCQLSSSQFVLSSCGTESDTLDLCVC